MNQGQSVFAQIVAFLSHNEFRRCVQRYDGDRSIRRFSCWDQFLAMAFAQLTYRGESLRDIEVCLTARQEALLFGFPWIGQTIYPGRCQRETRLENLCGLAQTFIQIARPLYSDTDPGLDIDATVYALDATTIDRCLSLCPWARFRRAKGAVKLHTMIDL